MCKTQGRAHTLWQSNPSSVSSGSEGFPHMHRTVFSTQEILTPMPLLATSGDLDGCRDRGLGAASIWRVEARCCPYATADRLAQRTMHKPKWQQCQSREIPLNSDTVALSTETGWLSLGRRPESPGKGRLTLPVDPFLFVNCNFFF